MRILILSIVSLALVLLGNEHIGKLPALGRFFSPGHGFWQNGVHVPSGDIQLDIEGLTGEVQVILDDRLVPHIYANTLLDACRVQGYLHAKYRLWQMDLTQRATLGRLSEIFGKSLLDFDKRRRQIGLPYAADLAFEAVKKDRETLELLQAYADGVNAYIEQLKPSDYPIEFKLLGYEPEKVSPYNTVVIAISMAEVLCFRNEDIAMTNNLMWLGKEDFEHLFPLHNAKEDPVIPKSVDWDFSAIKSADSSKMVDHSIGAPDMNEHPKGLGSNNWAVAEGKSTYGTTMLANDPHLRLTLPSVWYENHISTPDVNVYGVSFPGAPGVIIGFNDSISWGITNVGLDVLDWYEIRWADEAKSQYWLDGKKKDVELRIETYKLKNGKTITDTVKWTYWGPVISKGKQDLAMHWILHDSTSSNTFKTFIELNKASNYSDFKKALQHFKAPAQNFLFASVEGDIAIHPQGRYPLRADGASRFVQDGSISRRLYQYVPSEHNPYAYNPPQEYLASANQRTTGTDYPYFYYGDFEQYRGRIINRYLREAKKLSIEDFMDFQNSNYSILAEELLPVLLSNIEVDKLSKNEKEFYDLLKEWDYSFDRDSRAASLFSNFVKQIQKNLWDEFGDKAGVRKPGTVTTTKILSAGIHPFIDKRDTRKVESAKELTTLSFKQLVDQFDRIEDIPLWHKQKNTTISHLAKIPAFSEHVKTGGFSEALNAQTQQTGPSWRMIVKMSKPIEAYGVYPGGQSGHPGSPHYTDMLDHWVQGKYYKLNNSRDLRSINKSYGITFK